MQNELESDEYFAKFVSGGPKNYAYRVMSGIDVTKPAKTICKVRGITLNYNASKVVNFDVIRKMVLKGGPRDVVIVHTDKKIKRKRKGGGGGVSIVTEPDDKMYRISFLKRRRLSDNNFVPFRYK
jgi:hypothetical protein